MIVLKFGGHAMGASNEAWMLEIAERWRLGEKFVIVHGGGPQIDIELKSKGIEPHFVDGFRTTTPEIMTVVEMVLTGSVLRSVIRSLRTAGLPAVGITGADGGLLDVVLRDGGRYGLVGEVRDVDPTLIATLLDAGFLPVVSPVALDETGRALNINADIAAGAIAGSLRAAEIIYLTDVPGIYARWPDPESFISEITGSELAKMKFEGGMVPKVESAVHALRLGAQSVRIIDGKSIDAFHDALAGKGGTWVRN